MKIRNGFVSNSSSSSFVLVFDKKPKSVDEVQTILFGDKKTITMYDQTITTKDASIVISQDVREKKRATLKDVIDTFKHRYYYHPNTSCVIWTGRENDELGGSWSCPIDRYYLSDKTLMKQLRDVYIESEKREKELNQKYWDIMNTQFLAVQPPPAYECGKDCKGTPYTHAEIKAYNAYEKKRAKFMETNKDYITNEAVTRKHWNTKFKQMDELKLKIAKKDAKNFMDDNKGKYIFITEYADDSKIGCTLEHGNVFKNIAHIQISNH
jgi:hypothetical protein